MNNQYVVKVLKHRNAVFADDLHSSFNERACHKVHAMATQRLLKVLETTYPLVRKVNTEIQPFHGMGLEIILIGDEYGPRVQGSSDQSDGVLSIIKTIEQAQALLPARPKWLAYVTLITTSVNACDLAVMEKFFSDIVSPNSFDICYAAQNRQYAVVLLVENTKYLIVLDSASRLREVTRRTGSVACLFDDSNDIDMNFLRRVSNVDLIAGAFSSGDLINAFIEKLKATNISNIEEITAITKAVQIPLHLMSLQRAPCC